MSVKYAAKEDRYGHVDLSATGSGNKFSGDGGCGGVRPLPQEYFRPVYCHSANTGDISGKIEMNGGVGVN